MGEEERGASPGRFEELWAGWDSEVKGEEIREQALSQTELTFEMMTPSEVTPVNMNTPTENVSPL